MVWGGVKDRARPVLRPFPKAGGPPPATCQPRDTIKSRALNLLQDFSDDGRQLIGQRGGVEVVVLLK